MSRAMTEAVAQIHAQTWESALETVDQGMQVISDAARRAGTAGSKRERDRQLAIIADICAAYAQMRTA